MLILAKAALALMVSFIISVIFGFVLIPFLKKMNAKQKVSIFLQNKHKKKDGTPTMGGLIFIIPTILSTIILIFMNKIEWTDNLFIIMFVFLAYALLGFIDDYLIIKRHNNDGLTEIQKLIGQILIAVIFFLIFMKSGRNPVLDIHTLGITIDMGWLYGLFILFVLVASSNAVNLTDGLDGLAGGLSTIAFISFGIISFGSNWIAGNQDIGVFCFILVGSLLGFLVYNTHPAKVFMGDTGSLALGATLASVAILTSHEITLIVVAGVFVFETICSLIQMIAGRYFNRKIFLMAPFHHHLEKLGWQETDIVKLFWIIGMVLGMGGIFFGVWL
ncbi:MAG: phospho-N-acetylmuramoyl-pentapeptide-transferase [Firmicutes bacterium]|nr:phospho-N-acetylmuramoyl-pentapeptide-transferase [Bacillota bacterium]